jgi:VWFA-related protein
MGRGCFLTVCWLAVAFPAVAAAAQGSASAAEPRVETFGESIDVRLVDVEAVVTDGKGELVRGLGAADFRLLVDGREVPVEYFTEVAEGKAASPAAPAGPAPALPAGEPVGRSYLVYVDDSFVLAHMRDAMLTKLERDLTLLQPGDRMAVLAFDGRRIAVESGWTADVAALRAALERVRNSHSEGAQRLVQHRGLQRDVDWAREMGLDLDELLAFLEATSHRMSPEARTQLGRTAAAAAGALRGFEVPPGRKVMLLLSAAWTMEVAPQLYGPMLEAANRLGYTIYPVDLGASSLDDVAGFDALAAVTGGRAVVSAKLESFREVVADTGSYYWLGFTPAWKADDGRHRITVEPRRAGLKVRSRDGFSDLSPGTVNALKAESVALFGGAAGDRRLLVRLGEPRRAAHGLLEIPVTLGVPVESLALTARKSGFVAETPLAVLATDVKGRRADLPPTRLRVALRTLPRSGTFARFQTAILVRDIGQTLVFTVLDPVKGSSLWGEAAYAPQEAAGKGAVARR